MSNFRGINSTRQMLNPSTTGVQQEIRELQRMSPAAPFVRAVVVHVLNDPTSLSDEDRELLSNSVTNSSFTQNFPRNSLVVRIISGGADRRGISQIITYPFLPSHLSLPIKAGEQVWILYENPEAGGNIAYWMWKTSEPDSVEDLNYTHADRKFLREAELSTIDKLNADQRDNKPSFPNGAGTQNSFSLKGEKDYETIVTEDPAMQNYSYEAVPRYTKRPGDYVMQGSHNTLIVLGEDRRNSVEKDENIGQSGTIDIVVGRGYGDESLNVIENTRGNTEINKNPKLTGANKNPNEGNPDFVSDLARLFVSMNTDGDKNLNLKNSFPESFTSAAIEEVDQDVYAIVKGNEVRVVGRGSIRIIRVNDNGENTCGIFLMPDGSIQLDADKIFLGRARGNGTGPNNSEPYMKASVYKKQIENIIDNLVTLLNSFAIAFGIPIAAPGTPHPGLASQGVTAIGTSIAKLNTLKASIDDIKSNKLFGE
jgi:hypothetical protein